MTKKINNPETPYLLCECRQGCRCESRPGLALIAITRNGVAMKVCSYCYLPGDEIGEILASGTINPHSPHDDLRVEGG